MEDISVRIMNKIRRGGRDKFVSSDDFSKIAGDATARQVLKRLEAKGELMKIERGLWYYPKTLIDGTPFFLCEPKRAIEGSMKKNNVRIIQIPTSLHSALHLGENAPRFLTDGPTRHLSISDNISIEGKHSSDTRIFLFKSQKIRNTYILLKFIGEKVVNEEQLKFLDAYTRDHGYGPRISEFDLLPSWMRKKIEGISGR